MVFGGEVKGQTSNIYATYVGPPPTNTGGSAGAGGNGGIGGSNGVIGSFTITGHSNINDADLTNFATLAPISGQGGGLLGSTGGTSSAYINLNFSGAILPKTGTSIIIKLTAGTLGGVQVQAYNGITALGSAQSFSSLPLKGTNEYVFITPADCNSIRITSTTSAGALLGGISTNSTNIYYAYILDPNCNPPVYTAIRKTTILDLGSAISNETNAIDGNLNTFSLFSNGLGVGTTLYQTVYFSQPSPTGSVATLTLSIPPAVISAGVLGYININTYNGATLVSNTSFSGLLLGTDLLTLLNSGGKTTISIAPPSAFDRVELSASSLLSLATSLNLYEVQITPPKPTFTAPGSTPAVIICSGTSVTLKPDAPDSGNELRWYDSLTSTTLLANTNTYTPTPSLTATKTYYVATARTNCNAESERVPIIVTVNPLPTVSAIIGNANICVGVGYTFTNTSEDPGVWSTNNSSVATVDGTGFVKGVSVGTANITYTITNTTTHCSNSTSFTVDVSPLPTISLGNIPAICKGTTAATLPYTAVSSGSLKYDIIWNTTSLTNVSGADLPTSPIQLSIPSNAPVGTYTGTFSIRNTTSNCTNSYPISLMINQSPVIIVITNPTACKGITNATLTYTSTYSPTSYSINWDSAAITDGFVNVSSDTPLPASNISIIVPTTANVTTYAGTISVKNANGCISPPVTFNMIIHPKPPLPQVNITSN